MYVLSWCDKKRLEYALDVAAKAFKDHANEFGALADSGGNAMIAKEAARDLQTMFNDYAEETRILHGQFEDTTNIGVTHD